MAGLSFPTRFWISWYSHVLASWFSRSLLAWDRLVFSPLLSVFIRVLSSWRVSCFFDLEHLACVPVGDTPWLPLPVMSLFTTVFCESFCYSFYFLFILVKSSLMIRWLSVGCIQDLCWYDAFRSFRYVKEAMRMHMETSSWGWGRRSRAMEPFLWRGKVSLAYISSWQCFSKRCQCKVRGIKKDYHLHEAACTTLGKSGTF